MDSDAILWVLVSIAIDGIIGGIIGAGIGMLIAKRKGWI